METVNLPTDLFCKRLRNVPGTDIVMLANDECQRLQDYIQGGI